MELFDYLKCLTVTKEELDFEDEEISRNYVPYMINRFISTVDIYVPLVNEINQFPDIPKETHYQFFLNMLPKRKQYFDYSSLKKEKEATLQQKKMIAHYFQVNLKIAQEYISILSEEEIQEITKIYQYGKNSTIEF
jgi:hypothetical protein